MNDEMISALEIFVIKNNISIKFYDKEMRLEKQLPNFFWSIPFTKRKLTILKKTQFRCAYCNKFLDINFHLDHIYPKSKGGRTTIENLIGSCPQCNLKKWNKVL